MRHVHAHAQLCFAPHFLNMLSAIGALYKDVQPWREKPTYPRRCSHLFREFVPVHAGLKAVTKVNVKQLATAQGGNSKAHSRQRIA